MKTKIVYVTTSTPNDIYLEQTYLSIYSLRKHNADAHVILVTDNRTAATLTGNRAAILDCIDENVVVDFDESVSNMKRSRFLKTSMRQRIEGDFLYIDGDTLINDSLAEIDTCKENIGAVEDAHRPLSVHYGKEKLERQSKELGFNFSSEQYYFNGGVFFVKDNAKTQEFFRRWHENWQKSSKKGINLDMPALIQTNIEMGHIIGKIGGEWNCQLMYGFNYFTSAKIIHYFASRYNTNNGGYIYSFMDPAVFQEIKETGAISTELEEKIMQPLSCFSDQVELIGGSDVDLLNTHAYKFLRLIFLKHTKTFQTIQKILYILNKMNKRKIE
jgi:lipopolysaccharide biosynthesis glycosyltransferase